MNSDKADIEALWENSCVDREKRIGSALLLISAGLVLTWTLADLALEPKMWSTYLFWRVLNAAAMMLILVLLQRATRLSTVRGLILLGHVVAATLVAMVLPRNEHYAVYVIGYSAIPWASGLMMITSWQMLTLIQIGVFAGFLTAHLIFPVVPPSSPRPSSPSTPSTWSPPRSSAPSPDGFATDSNDRPSTPRWRPRPRTPN